MESILFGTKAKDVKELFGKRESAVGKMLVSEALKKCYGKILPDTTMFGDIFTLSCCKNIDSEEVKFVGINTKTIDNLCAFVLFVVYKDKTVSAHILRQDKAGGDNRVLSCDFRKMIDIVNEFHKQNVASGVFKY